MIDDRIILLAEDNDDDAELTALAFAQARIVNPVVRARDGVEALDWLFARGDHAGRGDALPVLVLLDLRMPRLGGIEVLAGIRADARTRFLPVVVLTSSAEESDRLAAYANHANSYVRKPIDYDQFVTAAQHLGRYWMQLNLLAPAGDPR